MEAKEMEGDKEIRSYFFVNESKDPNTNELNSSKESEPENIDAIRKFLTDHENSAETTSKTGNKTPEKKTDEEGNVKQSETSKDKEDKATLETTEAKEQNVAEKQSYEKINLDEPINVEDEKFAFASSVMNMILSYSEAEIAKKEDSLVSPKQGAAGEKGNSMSLSVGTKVEAKDFGEDWHPAQIVEVDYDEMEVLVHYENAPKRHDEWISLSSPRLRPTISRPPTPILIPDNNQDTASTSTSPEVTLVMKEELKHEEKPKLTFVVGERCLARWRDNRRFIATINHVLEEGKYEVMFDDGVKWTCSTARLSKLKEPSRRDSSSVDTYCSPTLSTSSPAFGPAYKLPGETIQPLPPLPAFHTHLFDPTRDYLGSKSERRAMKRKLNIKEIFNIGLKKKKEDTPKEKPNIVVDKKPKVKKEKAKRKPAEKVQVKVEVKKEIKKELPDAVASIIGTVAKEPKIKVYDEIQTMDVNAETDETKVTEGMKISSSETLSAPESQDIKQEYDSAQEEEVELEKLEPADGNHVEVIGKIKEAINKLEDGLLQAGIKSEIESPKLKVKDEIVLQKAEGKTQVDTKVIVSPKAEGTTQVNTQVNVSNESVVENISEIVKNDIDSEKSKKGASKIKRGKKIRLLQQKKVKKQVEKVKNELEEMKKQMEEMRKQMFEKTEELSKSKGAEMPESFLLPGEWCCKWVNGQPVGKVSEVECEVKVDGHTKPLLRRSVEVEDKRLPPGWTKHMVRRSIGNSAGKWDVVLMSPENRKFHTKTDLRNYLEQHPDEKDKLKDYEAAILDFGIHIKLSRRMGWYSTTPDGEPERPLAPLPAGALSNTSPLLVKNKSLNPKRKIPRLDNKSRKEKNRNKLRLKSKMKKRSCRRPPTSSILAAALAQEIDEPHPGDVPPEYPPLEDGFVYVGSLKVQVIENLLRCPAEGCFKNFRNNTLLKMHIKHYHRELRKMLGATPKVLDLAFARTRPNAAAAAEMSGLKLEAVQKTIKIKLPRLPRKFTDPKRLSETKVDVKELNQELFTASRSDLPVQFQIEKIPRSLDSPKMRAALSSKSVKRPKVLLPVRRLDVPEQAPDPMREEIDVEDNPEPKIEVPDIEALDFETAISTHTVTKPLIEPQHRGDKKKTFASIYKNSDDDEWYSLNNSDVETRSSYPRSGTPDSKHDQKFVSSESNEEQKNPNMYTYTENGERIKIVHMKREEIINCHCGFREEDGLMVQCELCLCWQHALCHNIQREVDVPEKYTCSICLNPRRGRRSQRFLHDQDRLYEGLLPGAKPCDALRRSHELSGNLIRIEDALHALRVKYHVATKKDHPKLYLWAKDWENSEASLTQEKLNSDYSDLNIMIGDIGKENLPMKADEMKDLTMEIKTPPSSDQEVFSVKNQLGSQSLLSGLLSSPSGASLELPISAAELERLANCVQEQEVQRAGPAAAPAPVPEAAIENSACRERLLRHVQRCQALVDARLDSIEAQVAELESQDPSFEDDETADYFPRTKQTIQMLMRDLDTMEELGVIT